MVAAALPPPAEPRLGADDRAAPEPSTRSGCDVFRGVERRWPPEQDPGARWVLGSVARPAASRWRAATASRPPPATRGSRTTGSTSPAVATFPEHRRRGLARAVSERLFAWGARARRPPGGPAGRRRKIAPRRRFTSSSDSARATSIATSFRRLTNTPFRASQGPDGRCRCPNPEALQGVPRALQGASGNVRRSLCSNASPREHARSSSSPRTRLAR